MATKRSLLHKMKRHDLRPYLQVKIFNPDGTARDLTGDLINFNMKDTSGNLVVDNQIATLVLASQGLVEYRWQAGDTDGAGVFRGEFVINGIDTFPKEGYIQIEITEDLD